MKVEELTNPVVRQVIGAINAGDRDAFQGALAPGAELTDDGGSPQPLAGWAEREIFAMHGSVEIEEEEEQGLRLTGKFKADNWTASSFWHFHITGDKVRRLDVGSF
jgi:hypothetical protein